MTPSGPENVRPTLENPDFTVNDQTLVVLDTLYAEAMVVNCKPKDEARPLPYGPHFTGVPCHAIVYSFICCIDPRRGSIHHGGYSSVGRAPDCGSGGRAFEPR